MLLSHQTLSIEVDWVEGAGAMDC